MNNHFTINLSYRIISVIVESAILVEIVF